MYAPGHQETATRISETENKMTIRLNSASSYVSDSGPVLTAHLRLTEAV